MIDMDNIIRRSPKRKITALNKDGDDDQYGLDASMMTMKIFAMN